MGGVGYVVLGFEKITTNNPNFASRFVYSTQGRLAPGHYSVKPLVSRNGAPVDGTLHSGDGSGDYSLLLGETAEMNFTIKG
jgi:hypothetical protein